MMVRNRQRITNKSSWTLEDLRRASNLVDNGISIRKAAQQCRIPYQTLQKRLKLKLIEVPAKMGRNAVFTEKQEKEIAVRLITLSNLFYGLTAWQLRRLAFECAETLNINHPFNKQQRLAGVDWLTGFLKRNTNLSLRRAEATSLNRVKGFNKEEVSRFFENLQNVMTKHKFSPSNMYNMDETGISVVHEPGKVLAEKGKRRVGAVTSGERGKNITVICAMSASGKFIPPLFIFPRKRHTPLLEKDGPPDAQYHLTPSGWTNDVIFLMWLKHFARHAKTNTDEPILIVLDNHCSHATLAAYNYCRENNITLLSLPPHSSHRMQPLDTAFFGPLKKAYNSEYDVYLKSHHLSQITVYEVASLFNKAYSRVASIEKAVSGFRTTGIFPIQPNIFSDEDFINTGNPTSVGELSESPTTKDLSQRHRTPSPPAAGCSFWPNEQCAKRHRTASPKASEPAYLNPIDDKFKEPRTLVEVLNTNSPLPDLQKQPAKRQTRSKQHSEIITITPMKLHLEEKEQKRQEKLKKECKSGKKQRQKTQTKQKSDGQEEEPKKRYKEQLINKRKKVTRKVFDESSDEDCISEKDLCDDQSDNENETELCLICFDSGKDGELWFRCTSCGRWVHAECSGVNKAKNYICDICFN